MLATARPQAWVFNQPAGLFGICTLAFAYRLLFSSTRPRLALADVWSTAGTKEKPQNTLRGWPLAGQSKRHTVRFDHAAPQNDLGLIVPYARSDCHIRRLNSNPGHFGLSIGFPESFLAPAGGHPMQG